MMKRDSTIVEEAGRELPTETPNEPAAISWSGGKDSCLALYEVGRRSRLKVEVLLATVNRDHRRLSMHGVRAELIERQASSLGLPLELVSIPANASNEEYECATLEAFELLKRRGIESVVFGDLFLEDIRAYRTAFLSRAGMKPVFPIWDRDTAGKMREFLDAGFKAIVVCVDASRLDDSFVGRVIDREFVSSLPECVDPCGENGEFHSFVFDGPIFLRAVEFEIGQKVYRDGFWFCDLIPGML